MGCLRLYLALAVLVWHTPPIHERWVPHSFTAVICFFVISGFYITMVLNEAYREDVLRFYLNRAARLYPAYLVVLVAVWIASALNLPGIRVDVTTQSLWETLGQAAILPRVIWDTVTLNPGPQPTPIIRNAIGPIYTVGLEMLFYLVAPLFVRRRILTLVVILLFCAIAHAAPYSMNLPQRQWQYEFFPGILLFFVMGCLSYHLYLRIKDLRWSRSMGYACFPLIVALVWTIDQPSTPAYVNSGGAYALYALVALCLPFLFVLTRKSRVDHLIGATSYPLYVVHAPVVDVLAATGLAVETWLVRGIALLLASVIVIAVELPVEHLRSAIRPVRIDGRPFSGLFGTSTTKKPVRALP